MLNLCRVVRAYETHKLSSKNQGGEWGLQNFPAEFHEMIQTALEGYAHKKTDRQKQFLTENLSRFFEYSIERIANS